VFFSIGCYFQVVKITQIFAEKYAKVNLLVSQLKINELGFVLLIIISTFACPKKSGF